MKKELENLTLLINQLRREQALRKRIKFLERELKNKPAPQETATPDSAHLEKLRGRIKELETENHELTIRLKRITDELG